MHAAGSRFAGLPGLNVLISNIFRVLDYVIQSWKTGPLDYRPHLLRDLVPLEPPCYACSLWPSNEQAARLRIDGLLLQHSIEKQVRLSLFVVAAFKTQSS